MTRTTEQQRLGSAFHEAGHVCYAKLVGIPVVGVRLMDEDGNLVEEGTAGLTTYAGAITDLADANSYIEATLAGIAVVRIAHSSGLLADEEIGFEEVVGDAAIDFYLTAPPTADRGTTAAMQGFFEGADTPDEISARELAGAICQNDIESAALLRWLGLRVAARVQEPKFLYAVERLAGALMELNEMDGVHIDDLMQRWDTVYRPQEEEVEDA